MSGAALAAAAEALAGTPFRLHGRDPATGLDCVGLLAAALRKTGRAAPLPTGYCLRMRSLPRLATLAEACGLTEAAGAVLPGDVLLVRTAPCQLHLLIALSGDRFAHAHIVRRRVIVSPGPIAWPIAGHWRL